ncbi:MAG: VWA domain-containing protein [Pirellulales bacterium]|nr:VWA domain-containing protein [Pirellulales bacterium]
MPNEDTPQSTPVDAKASSAENTPESSPSAGNGNGELATSSPDELQKPEKELEGADGALSSEEAGKKEVETSSPSEQESPAAAGSGDGGVATKATPAAKRAVKKKAVAAPALELFEEEEHLVTRGVKRSFASLLFSMVLHIVVVVALGLWTLPETISTYIPPLVVRTEEEAKPLETEVLDEQLEAATEMVFGPSSAPTVTAAAVSDTKVEQITQDSAAAGLPISDVDISGLLATMAGDHGLIKEVPTGTHGQARSVVDNYSQAMDRITQAVLQMLYKDDVLVIWLFDQSESMKDDQKQIRDRIERVYQELGLSDRAKGEHLLTAVVSFGEGFTIHTQKATAEMQKIREAIDAVPIDKSGKEITCQAIGRSINHFRKFAVQGKRRLALILVTDESGEPPDNLQYLEAAIQEAKSAQCRIYILGREAVFGYPYAHIRWVHPQTGRPHWLRIDRGPETGFVEQIQTDGFHRRYDAFPSGYGPYEQSRIAAETGGAFFLLPSLEPNLVRGENRRYELDAMRGYRPDLRPREKIVAERDKFKLRTILWKIINDLNPYRDTKMEMREHFAPEPAEFIKQVPVEHAKAKLYLEYLAVASKELDRAQRLRDDEPEPRWKANFDLMHAQLLAYQVRMLEHGLYLEEFVKKPRVVPLSKPPNLKLTYWDLSTRKERLTGDKTVPTIEKATALFNQVIKDHPGTPWAARAQWELARGYGVILEPYYEPPYKEVKNPIPLPKL